MNIYLPFQNRFRPKRLQLFYRLFRPEPHTKVLDLGGGAFFWDLAISEGLPLPQITVLNLRPPGEDETRSYLKWMIGDACSSEFGDNSFDIIFSNSLIEHLGNWDFQSQFAQEVKRLAPRYFVQTPDKYCPIEPHFITPFVHWLPKQVRRRMLRNFTFWGLSARPSQSYCNDICEEIALLSKREMRLLFPEARILCERFGGVPKSLIAVCTGEDSAALDEKQDDCAAKLTRF